MKLRVIGIYREIEFSPGKVDADRSILDAVLDQLKRQGAETKAVYADALDLAAPPAELTLAMCQSGAALKKLALLESAGTVVINSALGIRNCYRDLLGTGLLRAGVPTPRGWVVRTVDADQAGALDGIELSTALFVKRGDLHALGPEDVQRVEDLRALKTTLKGFQARGIATAYLQQEARGQVAKFYGVGSGAEYFSAATEDGRTVESQIGRQLRGAASDAARALGVEVWGGDAMIDGERLTLVDFNDWPSFAPVIDHASEVIAAYALARARRGAKYSGRAVQTGEAGRANQPQ